MAKDLMDKIMSLCKRRGIIFQSSEIYGGISSCYDYGPLGVELKRNLKDIWWKRMTQYRDDIKGLDSGIIMHPKIWEASGHVESFNDPLVECKTCHHRFKEDALDDYDFDWKEGVKKIARAYTKLDEESPLREKIGKVLLSQAEDEYDLDEEEGVPQKALKRLANDDKIDFSRFDEEETEHLINNHRQKIFLAANEAEIVQCPVCGSRGTFTEPKMFHLMFETNMGPVKSKENTVFLRPETAQGIYVNFQNVLNTSRQKVPFGIAQIGKAFRNEITPGNFIFRTREFEQMEMQYFVKPDNAEEWFEHWKESRMEWYLSLGIKEENLKLHTHREDELAHYAKQAVDIRYNFPFGWDELEGIHNRTDFDLRRHSEYSHKDLEYYDQERDEKYLPYIVETSGGIDRTILTILVDAYEEEGRRVMKFHPKLAPVKVGIFPLVNDDGMPKIAKQITENLKGQFKVFYDDSGSIGRRYRRQDEAGTPYCITVDSQTLEDDTVTIRERDTMNQIRVHIDDLGDKISYLQENYQRDAGFPEEEKE